METYTEKFDQDLDKIEHFQRFPAMKPYIGHNYGKDGQLKILLIGESYYLPKDSTINKDFDNPDKWYNSKQSDLYKKEEDCINCRQLLDRGWKDPGHKGHKIYRALDEALFDSGLFNTSKHEKTTPNVAYMNGFQRPSPETGSSIKPYFTDKDIEISVNVIKQVVSIIKPNLVIFVSKLSWDKLGRKLKDDKDIMDNKDMKIAHTYHPRARGRSNWRNSPGGKKKFISIIQTAKKSFRKS